MVEEQQFCLRWNNFQVNITSQFETLRDEEDFVDVTLACEGQRLKAHKVVLSACSPYFKDLFKSNPCKHPILFMRDVEFRHLKSLVEFMYAGEVNVAQAQLSAFLRTAESLQIRGLTEAPQRHKQLENLSTQGPTTSVTQLGAPSHSGSSRPHSASPGDGAHTTASSPEADRDDDEVLSLSPPSSPSPAKRVCRDRSERSERVEQMEPHEDTSTRHTHPLPTEQLDAIKNESPDIVEPKMEVPDYSSDGESRTDSGAMSGSFLGLDNSVDMNTSFAGLHGGMEILPGTSAQGFMGETSQDSTQVDHRKLHSLDPRPCPICYRMYSNLSNLRQHLRLIHNPQTVACPLCSKPFKTKLYLKRHLMSFHELLCTAPKASAAVVPGQAPPEFFPPPQIILGNSHASEGVTEDKSAFHNSVSSVKNKDCQENVSDYFQTRGFQNSSQSGAGEDRSSFISVQTNHQEIPPFQTTQAHKEERGTFLSPSHIRSPDRPLFRHNQQNQSKGQDVSNFLNTMTHTNDGRFSLPANASSERPAPYVSHPQGANQETPPFLSLLSLAKNEDSTTFLNPAQAQDTSNENKSMERDTNDSLGSN